MKIQILIFSLLFSYSSLVSSEDTKQKAQQLYEMKKYKEAYELLSGIDSSKTHQHNKLQTYKLNYFSPFSHRFGGTYRSYDPSDRYVNTEAQMELSLRYDFYENLIGYDETYSFGYTQKSFWQIYKYSTPFRETNYHPEIFVTIPLHTNYKGIELYRAKLAFEHESNGQGDVTSQNLSISSSLLSQEDIYWLQNSSRSWNFISLEFGLRYNSALVDLKLWHRLSENPHTDDNPDLIDYLGFGEINLFLPYKKHQLHLVGRYNFLENLGAIEVAYSYPFFDNENILWFVKFFSGFGESLIDYNQKIDTISMGFRFIYP